MSHIYIGEAATLVRDLISHIKCCLEMTILFRKTCQLSEEEFVQLENEVYIFPQARHQIAHVNNKCIDKFNMEEMKRCYENLRYDQAGIFK